LSISGHRYSRERIVAIKPYVVAIVLIVLASGVIVLKQADWSGAEALRTTLSLESTYIQTLSGFNSILLVPLGGLMVVFIRLTLGIRMLGPFRPILIAIGLDGAGIVVGLTFFVLVLVVMLLIQPRLRGHKLPYFARLTILVSVVVLLEIAMVVAGNALDIEALVRTMYFPIVVLCLASEGFARVLTEEGRASAIWRAATTMGAAVLIQLVHEIPGLFELQLEYPEVVLALIGAIIIVGRGMNVRWLDPLNPKPKPPVARLGDFGLGVAIAAPPPPRADSGPKASHSHDGLP